MFFPGNLKSTNNILFLPSYCSSVNLLRVDGTVVFLETQSALGI